MHDGIKEGGFPVDYTYNVERLGLKGDGLTDDTAAFQDAIDTINANGGGCLVFNPGTYVCDPIQWKSNVWAIFTPGSIIKAKTGFGASDRLLNFVDVSNVTIYGNHAEVRMLKSEYVSGEQRHGVMLLGCTDVTIYDLHSNDTGGDGFIIGASSGVPCQRITLYNCYANNNRRQGLSITSCIDAWVIGGKYSNTTGTAPASGIDIEPDEDDTIHNVNLIGVKTAGNSGSGIIVVPRYAGNSASAEFTVNIRGCESDGDGGNLTAEAGLRFDNGVAPTNNIHGTINVRDCVIRNSKGAGLSIGYNSWTKCPRLDIENVTIIDPCDTGSVINEQAGVTMNTTFASSNITNVHLRNVNVSDTRTVKKMLYPFLLSSGTTYILRDSTITDCDDISPTSPLAAPYVILNLGTVNVPIRNTNPRKVTFAAGGDMLRSTGLLITQTSSGALTLPDASLCEGQYFIFSNTTGSVMSITPASGDRILGLGLASSSYVVVMQTTGDYMVVKSMGGNSFQVIERQGRIHSAGESKAPRTTYGTSAPVADAWDRGDICINTSPTTGAPKSWLCEVSGTPGTWTSTGNL